MLRVKIYTGFCEICDREIKYTEANKDKKKICKVCAKKSHNKKKPVPPFLKSVKRKSKIEIRTMAILDELLREECFIDEGYYSWLRSPKGHPMQLDRFYPELNIAIEVQGEQHQRYTPIFHESVDDFLYYKECDKLKETICKKKNIKIIYVYERSIITEEILIKELKRIGIKIKNNP